MSVYVFDVLPAEIYAVVFLTLYCTLYDVAPDTAPHVTCADDVVIAEDVNVLTSGVPHVLVYTGFTNSDHLNHWYPIRFTLDFHAAVLEL